MSALASARRLAPATLRGVWIALAPGPRLRRRLGMVLALMALLGATYMLWARDSSLVAVENVEVTGATGKDAERLRAALDSAARGMTTLHVDRDALEDAAAAFPVVQAIEVEPDFPSGLRITVIEHRPVALLVSGDERIPVAADGSVLAGMPTEGSFPEIPTDVPIPAADLEPGAELDAARVAGAAPGVLLGRLGEIESESERGLVVAVDDGPELIFGSTDRLTAKWAAAVRVLADPDAAGAEYLDLRLPERPAAGGLTVETMYPVAPAGEAPVEAVPVAPVDPVEAAPVVPEAVPEAEPAPDAVAPAPAPVAPEATAPADPGGGALAEPQP